MATELVTMSTREIDVLDVVRKIHEQRLTQVKAGELLGLSDRQVRRLCVRYERDGAAGLVSRQRRRPSNHQLPEGLRDRAVAIVRERYADFGPTLAHERSSSSCTTSASGAKRSASGSPQRASGQHRRLRPRVVRGPRTSVQLARLR